MALALTLGSHRLAPAGVRRVLAQFDAPRETWEPALRSRLEQQPHCAVSRYLLALRHYERGDWALGVQEFMRALHDCAALESATLLVFSGLRLVDEPGSLAAALAASWVEFRRPAFDRSLVERTLFDRLEAPRPAALPAGALAARLWRIPLATLRVELSTASVLAAHAALREATP